MAEGLSYSTILPTADPDRDDSAPAGNTRTSESALRESDFVVVEPHNRPFSVAAEDSINGPVSHVPFLPIGGDARRKSQGSVLQRFFQWYNK